MIGIFGGSFDPVHLGHLGLAEAAYRQLGLERVLFVPLGLPPHRPQLQASPAQRVELLRAALEPTPYFEINTLEVEKDSPSWTVETLAQLRQSLPGETLCLLLGSDAFKPLNSWYRWRRITDYCHIVVLSRRGDEQKLNDEVADFLASKRTGQLHEMPACTAGNGGVLWLEAELPEISSTRLRAAIAARQPFMQYTPPAVAALIQEYKLYGYG